MRNLWFSFLDSWFVFYIGEFFAIMLEAGFSLLLFLLAAIIFLAGAIWRVLVFCSDVLFVVLFFLPGCGLINKDPYNDE